MDYIKRPNSDIDRYWPESIPRDATPERIMDIADTAYTEWGNFNADDADARNRSNAAKHFYWAAHALWIIGLKQEAARQAIKAIITAQGN